VTRVHQVTGAAGRHDAVTNQLLAYSELLRGWGLDGGAHAAFIAPGASDRLKPLSELEPAPEDVVLVHYSGWIAGMEPLLELPQRKLLVYHNITPAKYFWSVHPVVAVVCEVGREKLPALVAASRATAGVSAYNAAELRAAGARDPRVVPVLVDPGRFAHDGTGGSAEAPLVLVVGRLAPHKRPDLVIRAFALYQRLHAPGARLVLAGEPQHPPYRERLAQLVEEAGARNVQLAGGLENDALMRAYSEASVLLSLSEHEGFCMPLIEAFHAELPVIARPHGAMPEVGGDAVLWVEDTDDLAVVAELLHIAVTDADLRAELVRRGRRRAGEFAPEKVAPAVRELIDAALA
jgi:glycosyltransferase involved in cell wall biosynthesis